MLTEEERTKAKESLTEVGNTKDPGRMLGFEKRNLMRIILDLMERIEELER